MEEFWNERFSHKEFIYGKEPNKFFAEEILKIKPGKMISFGEGEGRNAVFAAEKGWNVDAVDFSTAGKKKTEMLASQAGVTVNYFVNNIIEYMPKENYYDLALVIYFHLGKAERKVFFEKVISSIKNSGLIIIEVFDKSQIKFNSGGPKSEDLLYSLEDIVEGFIDFNFIKLSREIVSLSEGNYHSGEASVIRFIGRKEVHLE